MKTVTFLFVNSGKIQLRHVSKISNIDFEDFQFNKLNNFTYQIYYAKNRQSIYFSRIEERVH